MRRALMIGGIAAALALVQSSPAYGTFPGGNGKVAFVSASEIWTVNPDGSFPTRLTDNSAADLEPVWSPASVPSRIAFASDRDGNGNHEIYVMNADGSDHTRLTSTPAGDNSRDPAWSHDGNRIFFTRYLAGGCSTLMTMNADGSAPVPLDPTPYCERQPDAAPDGSRIAFTTTGGPPPAGIGLWIMRPDGTDAERTPSHGFGEPTWSPGTVWLAIGDRALTPSGESTEFFTPPNAEWSPDGSWLLWGFGGVEEGQVRISNERVGEMRLLVSTAGGNPTPDWQPLPVAPPQAPYVRPKSANYIRFALVPAYRECAAPDRTHGPPLTFGSCSSPVLASDYLTVGTPDANGQPTRSSGHLILEVQAGSPSTPGNQADIVVKSSFSDIRCRVTAFACPDGPLSDYQGKLQAIVPGSVTDRFNSGLGNQPATVDTLWRVRITIPCTPTADTTVGSDCAVHTSLNTVMPGSVREGDRAVWNMQQVQIVDGGGGGEPADGDYTLFAVPGLFVP